MTTWDASRADPQMNPATRIRELRCIVKDVGQHLNETRLVAVNRDQLIRQFQRQLMTLRIDRRTCGLDRARNDGADQNRFTLQRDHAARDS